VLSEDPVPLFLRSLVFSRVAGAACSSFLTCWRALAAPAGCSSLQNATCLGLLLCGRVQVGSWIGVAARAGHEAVAAAQPIPQRDDDADGYRPLRLAAAVE